MLRHLFRVGLRLSAVFALLASAPLYAGEGKIDEAKRLLQANQPAAAYEVLKPLEDELSGVPRFDYLLGVAAMDTGRPVEALFALERAAAVAPDDPLVRIAYANALLGANEDRAAERQRAVVRKQVEAARELPDGVLQGLDRYSQTLSAPAFGQTTDFRGYVGISAGYDTNVNNSTNQKVVNSLFGTITLDEQSTQKSDFFATLLAGGSVIHPLRRDLWLNAAVSGSHRMLESDHSFETTSLQTNADLTYQADEQSQWSAGVFAQHAAVHMDANRTAFGATLRGKFEITARSQSSLFAQYTRNQYPADIRDSNRYVFGVGFRTLLPLARDPRFDGRVYFGREQQDESTVPHLGHDVVGAAIELSMSLAPKYSAYVGVAAERRQHLGPDPQFGIVREDRSYQASAGMTYLPAKYWQISPRVVYTRNVSNRPVSDFTFGLAEVSVVRSFN